MIIHVLDRLKNIVTKGENAGYQHFLLFPQCFQKPFSLRSLKVVIVWEKVNHYRVPGRRLRFRIITNSKLRGLFHPWAFKAMGTFL